MAPDMVKLPTPFAARLPVVYRTAGALLRELSRAVSRGQTLIRAESGLPAGTRLTLALGTPASKRQVEVTGTITSIRRRARLFEMALRYDFEPRGQQGSLDRLIAHLRHEDSLLRRRDPRVPLAIPVVASLGPGLAVSVQNLSRAGCRLEIRGRRLPAIVSGSRVTLSLRSGRPARSLRLGLDVRWVGATRTAGKDRCVLVGGRFAENSEMLRERLAAVIHFRDYRPLIRILKVARPEVPLPKRSGPAGLTRLR